MNVETLLPNYLHKLVLLQSYGVFKKGLVTFLLCLVCTLSSNTFILQIRRSNTSSGDNAFTSYVPKLWNALPLPIRQAPSLETFKKALKTHLFIA